MLDTKERKHDPPSKDYIMREKRKGKIYKLLSITKEAMIEAKQSGAQCRE